ncbi:hypothetical protein [Corynebacterium sp. A21]|uniref:hypothetical protein n=1 Tax=Corynebacterium sp. A21 TaxID=3457318 RepID=UPI003FD60939
MKFTLDIDLNKITGDPSEEISRALRYWAGNLKHYDLGQQAKESIYDSAFTEVGGWAITQ